MNYAKADLQIFRDGNSKTECKKERNFSMKEMMRVLYIQVGKKPQVIEIKHTLREMQRLVGGITSAYSLFDDGSVIILNDTGKLTGWDLTVLYMMKTTK